MKLKYGYTKLEVFEVYGSNYESDDNLRELSEIFDSQKIA
jgi:hypothetical protein